MASNYLDFTKLTFADIKQEISAKLATDDRFKTLRNSDLANMILDAFCAMTDMVSYNIERRAEESYLESAKNRSSVISLSRMLGYVVTRPTPSSSTISMTIRGGGALGTVLSSVVPGSTNFIQLPIFTPFTYNGKTFQLKRTYKYLFSASDITNFQSESYTKTIQYSLLNTPALFNLYSESDLINISDTTPVEIFEGTIKYKDVIGSYNSQLNNKFQNYKINDPTFSNIFGDKDYEVPVTRVCLNNYGSNPFRDGLATIANEYTIDRRSLLKQGEQPETLGVPEDICLIRTENDDAVSLCFGDGIYSSLGAQTGSKQNIYAQYLSTMGERANENGCIGKNLICGSSIMFNNGDTNISSNVSFAFTSNIQGGSDIETIESIKNLASGVFSSLDKLVSKSDYISYLKGLTTPVAIRNAIAAGESDIYFPKMFNIALFSCLGSLYSTNSTGKTWEAKDRNTAAGGSMASAVLDNIDLFTTESDNSYFNVVVKNDSNGAIRTLSEAQQADSTSKIGIVLNDLQSKSMMTICNTYMSPIIKQFVISGDIFVSQLSNASLVLNDIENTLYPYLNNKADFSVPLYFSDIIQLIENVKNVDHSNIYLTPAEPVGAIFGSSILTVSESFSAAALNDDSIITWAGTQGASVSGARYAELVGLFQAAYNSITVLLPPSTYFLLSTHTWDVYKNFSDDSINKTFITEKWFNETFLKAIYDSVNSSPTCRPFLTSTYWKSVISKLHSSLEREIMRNMLTGTNSQNITNYTLVNEIVQIHFSANVFYQT